MAKPLALSLPQRQARPNLPGNSRGEPRFWTHVSDNGLDPACRSDTQRRLGGAGSPRGFVRGIPIPRCRLFAGSRLERDGG